MILIYIKKSKAFSIEKYFGKIKVQDESHISFGVLSQFNDQIVRGCLRQW
jgi:hypothetical protein